MWQRFRSETSRLGLRFLILPSTTDLVRSKIWRADVMSSTAVDNDWNTFRTPFSFRFVELLRASRWSTNVNKHPLLPVYIYGVFTQRLRCEVSV
ncbi:hypothetical protein BJ165DRAFT_1476037 [Panaeolus papilionaceus]|nr:hypothetical protein BJ165DRAFT_1476037 [Panaeolus papilionaceus]